MTEKKIRESVDYARNSIKKIRSSVAALSLPGKEGGTDDDPCPDSR
ncbi:hypothetical protein SAMN02745177_01061 [Desulforamulus hydrothermalis Lam5 = DSM 18033]|nr:hypothetical protein SAMN02745177_01061 [Desulforamulus hydrothermalis Lam5 = DSM 18033]